MLIITFANFLSNILYITSNTVYMVIILFLIYLVKLIFIVWLGHPLSETLSQSITRVEVGSHFRIYYLQQLLGMHLRKKVSCLLLLLNFSSSRDSFDPLISIIPSAFHPFLPMPSATISPSNHSFHKDHCYC